MAPGIARFGHPYSPTLVVINGQVATSVDWDAAVPEADEADRPFVRAQARLAAALAALDGQELTGPWLGWLILAARALQASEDALALRSSRSPLALVLLQRAVGDSVRDLSFILGMGEESPGPPVVDERLGAYAAWCLWNDANDADRVLYHGDLNRVYDPKDTAALLSEPGAADLFPDLADLETDPATLRAQRMAHEEELHEVLSRSRETARRLGIDDWLVTLDNGIRKKEPYYSLYELVEGDPSSALDDMRRQGTAFGHSLYRRQSAAAHGSTARPFVHLGGEAATPLPAHPEVVLDHERNVLAGEVTSLVDLLEIARAAHPKRND